MLSARVDIEEASQGAPTHLREGYEEKMLGGGAASLETKADVE